MSRTAALPLHATAQRETAMRAENMTCKRGWMWALSLAVNLSGVSRAQSSAHDEQSVLPNVVGIEISFPRETFEVREPVVARVALLNRGPGPLSLRVHLDGAPLALALEVLRPDGQWTNHSLRLRDPGPQGRPTELQAGESTRGEVLVLGDYDRGYVF